MLAAFQVGDTEKHLVEVYSQFMGITYLDVIKVDGVEILSRTKFDIWLTNHLVFEVGDREKHYVELFYNALLLSSRAYVDGRLHVGCLFPQVIAYNALIIAILALLMAAIALVIVGIALVR